MSDHITITGIVGTEPRLLTSSTGTRVASFRIATSHRTLDRATGEWHDRGSNWYTVACFRELAEHVGQSVKKGERVIVTGRLSIRNWSAEGREGTNVDIEAAALGHDLNWGTVEFHRAVPTRTDEASTNFSENAA